MNEIIFRKKVDSYSAKIKSVNGQDDIQIILDTGSPITIICIVDLLKVSNETYISLIKKIDKAVSMKQYIKFGVYASQEHDISRRFVPYLLNDIEIGGKKLKFFLVWIDMTNYKETQKQTSNLFGFDYIKQGKKWFTEDDNFHIHFDNSIKMDIGDLKGALNSYKDTISSINEIKRLSEKSEII